MLTLIALAILREQSETNRHLRGDNAPTVNAALTAVLLAVFLWPLFLPAAIVRYVQPTSSTLRTVRDIAVTVVTLVPLLSLFFLGWQAYFVYGVIFALIAGTITLAVMNKIYEEELELQARLEEEKASAS